MEVKSGYKTSEFAAMLVNALVALGVLTVADGEVALQVAAIISMAVGVVMYIKSRTNVKAANGQPIHITVGMDGDEDDDDGVELPFGRLPR